MADLLEIVEKHVKIPTLPTFPVDRQLGGSNYGIWKVMMESVLESYDLADFVIIGVPRPEAEEGELLSTRKDREAQTQIWDRVNARVRLFIFLNCTPQVINHVKHMTLARGIWEHLASLYHRVSPMKRISLEVQMRVMNPAKSSTMREHINKLQAL